MVLVAHEGLLARIAFNLSCEFLVSVVRNRSSPHANTGKQCGKHRINNAAGSMERDCAQESRPCTSNSTLPVHCPARKTAGTGKNFVFTGSFWEASALTLAVGDVTDQGRIPG